MYHVVIDGTNYIVRFKNKKQKQHMDNNAVHNTAVCDTQCFNGQKIFSIYVYLILHNLF